LYKPRAYKSIYANREAIRLKNKKNKLWNHYVLTSLPADHQAFCEARNTLHRQLRHNFECNDTGSNPWQYTSGIGYNKHWKILGQNMKRPLQYPQDNK